LREVIGDQPVVVARELTKVHEELVRGPITEAIEAHGSPRGELTVVVEIGHITEHIQREPPEDGLVAAEFGRMIDGDGVSRRTAIGIIARKYGRRPNEIYAAVERGLKIGRTTEARR
jgi:16S rRNA (cytidine1402-2'-O)-methyltransferase